MGGRVGPQSVADLRSETLGQCPSRLGIGPRRVGQASVDVAAGVIMQAGMDLLPPWARAMHDQPERLPRPLMRAGATSAARFVRWAFDNSPNKQIWPAGVTEYP